MANANPYEGQQFEILGKGKQGDARIRLPNGRFAFVKGTPSNLRVGDTIGITNYTQGAGTTDFASYQSLAQQVASNAAAPQATPKPISEVYLLHIGPTKRGDDSAIAICTPEVLGMKVYDALDYLIGHHDDKTVFPESTDRRIAKSLYETRRRAEGDKALDELILTIADQPITPKTNRLLRDYFQPAQAGKYSAQAVVGQKESNEQQPQAPKKPEVHIAQSTVARKGSPGGYDMARPASLDYLLK